MIGPGRFVRLLLSGWIDHTPIARRGRILRRYARSRLLRLFYFAGRDGYWYEQRRVLEGRAQYFDSESARGDEPIYKLRRNTHRLEKGLSMVPRRPVFAADYITETVTALEAVTTARCSLGVDIFDETTMWSADVLARYFAVVDPNVTGPVALSRQRFEDLRRRLSYDAGDRFPATYGSAHVLGYDEILALATRRRSVRSFLPIRVDRHLLDMALTVAVQSPSACNRLAYEFRICDDPSLVRAMSKLAPGMRGWGEKVPCLVVIVGKYRAYPEERDRHAIYVDGALAAMSFQFALVSLGLASCCVNWPQIEPPEKEAAQLLGLEPDEKIVMCMAVGFPDPDGLVPASIKKRHELIRRFNV